MDARSGALTRPAFLPAPAADLPASDRELLTLWLSRSARRSPATLSAYAESLARFLRFAAPDRLDEVGGITLAQWQEDLARTLAPASVNRHVAAVRSFYRFGMVAGSFDRNPAAAVAPLPDRQQLVERIIAEADVLRMLDVADRGRDRILVRILYAGGLRVSEACALRWRHVKEIRGNGLLVVASKGGRVRSVLLSPASYAAICELQFGSGGDPEAPVFRDRRGRALVRQRAFEIVRKVAGRAGLGAISPHFLRHAHASHALERGAPAHLVQRTLGHRSLETTGRYLHARPTDSSGLYLAV